MSKSTHNQADYSDTLELQKRLQQSADAISAMAGRVAQARQIREYDGDRRKRALAVWALPFLKAGESASAADISARASEGYKSDMYALALALQAAEKTIMEFEAMKIQWESARSLLSLQRETVRNL